MPSAAKKREAKKTLDIQIVQPAPPAPAAPAVPEVVDRTLGIDPIPAGFRMRPVRPSMLDLAEDCGYAPTVAEKHPEGTEWSVGGDSGHRIIRRAFENGEEPKDPALAAIVDTLRTKFPDATWSCEVKVELFDPDTGERLFPEETGHVDLVGVLPDGRLIIVDWKLGFVPVRQPNQNLQVLGYGLAKALELGAPAFLPVIYQPNVIGWMWGSWHEDGADYWEVLDRIRATTRKRPDVPIVGAHCGRCYSASHCKAYMLPVVDKADAALAPFTAEGGLTRENAPEAIRLVKAMKVAIDVAETRLKALAQVEPILSEDGRQVWGPVLVKNGKRSITIEEIPQAILAELEERGVVKAGMPFQQFRWKNAHQKKGKAKSAGAHDSDE